MAAQSSGGGGEEDPIDETSAKDFLDSIGKRVHEQAKAEVASKKYFDELHGTLSKAKFEKEPPGQQTPADPCQLDYQYHTNATNGKSYPCRAGKEERFSQVHGGECDKNKISGNKDDEGACAPFRRLHLCVRNLENININKKIDNDTLLAEVCLAAKYEGDLIKTHYTPYQHKYDDSPSQICTMLARSFADIGDIVRGRDLFYGNTHESAQREKLEKNLKDIFKKIHSGLSKNGAQTYYNDDKDGNYYKLREDWWTANRATIWEAITCNAGGYSYFRPTCGSNAKTAIQASHKCRCPNGNNQVPTYFDYVPQYLRWFEEWAEDFCRKRKHKLENAIQKCRGQYQGKDRYCDLNGYDCEKTKRGRNKYRWDYKCTGCFLSCSHFRTWIDNQRKQFLKQKNKYDEEINGTSRSSRAKRAAGKSNYDGYESKFYNKLKDNGNYSDVNKFLEKLSDEDICRKIDDEEGGKIDFKNVNSSSASGDGDGNNKTFSHTTYCQACPLCGVERNGKEWKRKDKMDDCPPINLYKPIPEAKGTTINFLYSGDEPTEIGKKLKKFCQTQIRSVARAGGGGSGSNSNSKELYEEWKCYEIDELEKDKKEGGEDDDDYDNDVKDGGGLCILENKNKNKGSEANSQKEPEQLQKTFNPFFYYWVVHMLKDSIYWRTEKLDKCINNSNETKACKNNEKCNKECGCFQKWIKQKKEKEWDKIKDHFRKQKNIPQLWNHDAVLEGVLNKEVLLTSLQEAYGDTDDIKHIEELLDEEKKREKEDEEAGETDSKKKNTIDKLLQHEEDEAELCLEIHEDEEEGGGNDECDDDHEETQIVKSNPCATPSGSYPSLANKAAQLMHHKAKTQLTSRAGGRRTLKADASKGHYTRGGSGENFKKEALCTITDQHSNDERNTGEPCHGKDGTHQMFKLEKGWKGKSEINTPEDVFLPPRREHFCTSNLENLNTKSEGLTGSNASDSLLGDVLLSAKYEADYIKKKYKRKETPDGFSDDATMCRAMKYSFADLGDIIRGRDMWNKDKGSTEMETRLKSIFKKIKEQIPGIKDKYPGDDNNNPPYKQLREDWWEANRHQVWKAMKCSLKDMSCDVRGVPLDDYIPQRLRWMTEWVEWYCKYQSQEYETLQKQCGKCTGPNKDNCTRDNCNTCTKACEKYTTEIKKWQKQWTKIKTKYEELYLQAKHPHTGNAYPGADYQLMVDFLTQLIRKSDGGKDGADSPTEITALTPNTDVYFTAAGYIHQESRTGECQIQKRFCDDNEKYAFREKPNDHDNACACKSRPKPEKKTEKPKEEEPACKIVDDLFSNNTALQEACKQKYINGREKFPNWKCIPSGPTSGGGEKSGDKGAICIPPRRRRLYVGKLTQWAATVNGNKEGSEGGGSGSMTTEGTTGQTASEGSAQTASQPNSHPTTATTKETPEASLRRAFVKSAAVETFFLWDRYKKEWMAQKAAEKARENELLFGTSSGDMTALPAGGGQAPQQPRSGSDDPQSKLNGGDIPNDFLRQMFYTFGDYRDIFFGNDIGKDKDILNEKLNKVFANGVSQPSSGNNSSVQQRKKWWEQYGSDIWDAMVCALSYSTDDKKEIQGVRDKLIKPDKKNDYKSVTISSTPISGDTKLTDFVKRPTFFRWLQEWGEEFCKKRKIKIHKIKHECRSEKTGRSYCSGDGYDCTYEDLRHNNMFAQLDCVDCHEKCINYKNWIKNKENEFDNQKIKYQNEIVQPIATSKNDHDQTFYEEIINKKNISFDKFLQSLNHCNKWEDTKDVKNKTDFNKPVHTFSPSTYCKGCPLYGVNCGSKGECEEKKEKVQTQKKGVLTNIPIVINDGATNDTDNELQEDCKTYELYKDLRKQQWTCQKKKDGTYECNLSNAVDHEYYDDKIPFNILFQRWLFDFIQYYNKSKERITRCTNKGENKCDCVQKWINKKSEEWETIKQYYKHNLETERESITYTVKIFFEQPPFDRYANEAKKIFDMETTDDEIWGYTDNCEGKSKHHEKQYCDFITILIDKLQKKIDDCKTQHETSGKTQPCDENTPHSDETLDEQTDDDTTDNQSPAFCKDIQPPPPPLQQDACEIVGGILNGKSATSAIDGCNTKNYNGWNCNTTQFKSGHDGACMPPRRQKLCIHYLVDSGEKTKIIRPDNLRDAFIKSAAAETFLSWQKYKEDKKNEKPTAKEPPGDVVAQNQLNGGTIPEEFKRQMFYTFGDYRDLCLGKDIGNDENTKGISATVTRILSVRNDDKQITAENWWKTIENDVWKGMLCALSYDTEKKGMDPAVRDKLTGSKSNYNTIKDDLADFATRPQFLRWFTEWADQFCQEHKVEKAKLLDKCNNVDCSNEDESNKTIKQQCEKACTAYEQWIKDWKDQYNKQKRKFDKDKRDKKFDDTPAANYIDEEISAHEYLHEQLEKLCINGDCSCMEKTSTQNEETNLSGNNYFPEALDNPPKEMEEKCECSEPSEPMSCVEKTAHKIRKNAEKNIEVELKGNANRYNGNCKEITKDKYQDRNGGVCTFNKGSWSSINITTNQCESTGKERFKIGDEWNCNVKTLDGNNKLCIPPRRKHMCLNKLKSIKAEDTTDTTGFLQKIQEVAKNEGDDIIKNLIPENACNESTICDAMKYSFADIGDIIRGRDIYKNDDNKIEDKLQQVFKNIYDSNKHKLSNYNDNRDSKYTKLREKWWDANRREVWNAMTCNAPDDAKLLKKNESGTTTTSSRFKCGRNSDPPDYDYIPQPFRWLQESSEYYCKELKEKKDEMKKECEQCKTKHGKCENDKNDKICEECKTKCQQYKTIVDKWKYKFEEQNRLYKELYMKAKAASKADARRDFSIKFIQQLDKICEDPNTAEKYLDKSTHCTDYKFSETNNNENDAFSQYPNEHEKACTCQKKSSTDPAEILTNIIQNSFKPPKIPGLNKIEKAVPRIAKRIKNIRPDAHTIHELVAKSFPYFVPLFQEDDKTPPTHNILNDVLPSAIPVGIALALTSIAFLFLKKKTKSTIDLLRVINIPKSDYDIPTKLSPNRYIPYTSGKYRGKRYIYLEGDSGTDSGYTDHYSDITSSSESEYEEMDINDIYVPGSPKYKTLIEVVLEPSGNNTPTSGKNTPSDTQNDIQNDGIPSSKITDNEWNTLKDDFISNMLQNEPNTEPNILHDNLDNNTHPTPSRHTLDQKPFIMSIHDRNLLNGEEYNYNVNMSTNSMDDIPINSHNNVYSGIDLINDSLSGDYDIYNEMLKRKENELFGTEHHPKRTTTNHFATPTRDDPIHNQLNLFHTWLDRHRDMCEKWENHHERLAKLKELWENETHSGNTHPSDSNKTLNTNVSIQIHMDDPKPINEFTYVDSNPNQVDDTYVDSNPDNSSMDTILEDLDKPFNEPYYYDMYDDDIYYDVNDDNDISTVDTNAMDVPSKVQIEMDVNTKLVKEKYPIADVWDI
ncbi:PfEMP1 [Plasmodium falciparum Dd2]|uniref:PfEMP1 n=1 Tax=Plasmodium falciparum (isolate Dd2) TaxID=57267 RepID=A0A0L7M5W4_PLAF4|nr:PfEMP1 [Plasmodium falciparum Dd2]